MVPDYIEDIPVDEFDGKKMRYSKKQKLTANLELDSFEKNLRDFIARKLQDYYEEVVIKERDNFKIKFGYRSHHSLPAAFCLSKP